MVANSATGVGLNPQILYIWSLYFHIYAQKYIFKYSYISIYAYQHTYALYTSYIL